MATERKPLTGILPGGGGGNDDIFDRFDAAEAADDFKPLPRGAYIALAVGGRLEKARTGTDCYTFEFRVTEGEYTGRRVWLSRYFTHAAIEYTKRDLKKFGINSGERLKAPFPAGRFVVKLTIVVRKTDDGIERNEVKNIEVVRLQEPEADPYAPGAAGAGPAGDDTAFPLGANGGVTP